VRVTTNITNTSHDLQRFKDGEDIKSFCQKHHLDGLELLPFEENSHGILPAEMILGIHLSYHNCWIDFWNGNEAGVLSEFDDWDTAHRILGKDKSAIVNRYRAQLDFAKKLGVAYVVFHVSDISINETLKYQFTHTDEEVIDASLALINLLLDDSDYTFDFLVENLWWPGLNLMRPEMTRRLLEGIHYEKKGIMLDTGHLLHTNTHLTSQKEGLAYIHKVLDQHMALCSYIKGIHLQQSLTGDYVRAFIENVPVQKGDYQSRLSELYPHIHKIDLHRPFMVEEVRHLVDRINPKYLTHEFITRCRAEHEDFLTQQNLALWGDHFAVK